MKNTWKRLLLLAAFGTLTLAGCRGSGSKESGSGLLGAIEPEATPVARSHDPLFGDRIPKQNLPTRSSDAVGTKNRDPLFGLPPSGETNPIERAVNPEKKGATSRNGSIYPEPFRPGRETTNAALAQGVIAPDDSTMSIGPRRSPGAVTSSRTLQTYEQMVSELRRYGARIGEPTREKGNYVIRAEVPLDVEIVGPSRWYEGYGQTPAVALRQILDQVQADKAR